MNKDIQLYRLAKSKELKRLLSIAAGQASDMGAEGSPYCELFMLADCEACPIKLRSGFSDCRLSPYAEWARHQSEKHFKTTPPYRIECPECKAMLAKVYEYTKAAPIFMDEQGDLLAR